MNGTEKQISIQISRAKLITIFVSALLLFIVAMILWKQQEIDYNIIIKNNFIHENAFYLRFFRFISHYGMGSISILYSLLIFLSLKKAELKHNHSLFLFILFSFALGSIAGDLLKEVIDRARPAVELSGRIIQTGISDTSSFPSGHATKSMALALPFVIMAVNKDAITRVFKIIALLLAILVCYSRIALQKHFLSDVLAGAAIALFFLAVSVRIANFLYKKGNMNEKKLSGFIKRLGFIFLALAILLSVI